MKKGRDIQAYINDFQELYRQGEAVEFYPSEIQGIYEMSAEKWETLFNAFQFAFMVGYKHAREGK